MKLIEQMKMKEDFSCGEQQVIQYLLSYPSDNPTIAELAERTFTSNATIIRLCKKLGYDGYRSFRLDFIKEMEACKYRTETVDYDNPFHGRETANEIIGKLTNLYREGAELLMESINERTIEKISKEIVGARRIYIYAIGDSMITARAVANKFQKIDIYPILANEYDEAIAAGCNASSADFVMFFSYSLRMPEFLKVFRMLRQKHVPTAVITANEGHYITKNATYKIIIPPKETDFSVATFYSQFAFNYIGNLLYSLTYMNNYEAHKKYKNRLDEIRIK